MKCSLPCIVVLLLGILFIPFLSAQAKGSGSLASVDLDQRFITVEDLGAEFHTASNTIIVSAKIKNISRTFMSGYATIYLLSAEGQELYSYQEEVNRGESFAHGTTVMLEAASMVGDISKVNSISVDFTKR